jgi:hypothetical protein
MNIEHDVSGINPLRIKTARQRMETIEEYLSLPERSKAAKLAAATSLGLTNSGFQRLINSWIKYKDISRLVGNRKISVVRKKLQPAVRKMILSEIEAAGHEASASKIHRKVVEYCRTKRVKTPCFMTVYHILLEVRQKTSQMVGGTPRIVFGRMYFKLPIQDQSTNELTTRLAEMLVAVALPERIIISYAISVNETPASFTGLIENFIKLASDDAKSRPLIIDKADPNSNHPLFVEHGLRLHEPSENTPQRELNCAFGTYLGQLKTYYRQKLLKPRPEALLCRQDQPMTEDEAYRAIEDAIAENNAKWTTLANELGSKLTC